MCTDTHTHHHHHHTYTARERERERERDRESAGENVRKHGDGGCKAFVRVPRASVPLALTLVVVHFGWLSVSTQGEKVIIVFVVLMQLGICMVFFNYAAENIVAVEKYYLSLGNASCLETNTMVREVPVLSSVWSQLSTLFNRFFTYLHWQHMCWRAHTDTHTHPVSGKTDKHWSCMVGTY